MTREDYYKLHKYCPKCGGDGWSTTLVGYLFDRNRPEDYRDMNRVDCPCGWHGNYHDLIAKPEDCENKKDNRNE